MAGLTRDVRIPWIRRIKKAGGNVARDMARRACGVDFVKIVRARMGEGIVAVCRI